MMSPASTDSEPDSVPPLSVIVLASTRVASWAEVIVTDPTKSLLALLSVTLLLPTVNDDVPPTLQLSDWVIDVVAVASSVTSRLPLRFTAPSAVTAPAGLIVRLLSVLLAPTSLAKWTLPVPALIVSGESARLVSRTKPITL